MHASVAVALLHDDAAVRHEEHVVVLVERPRVVPVARVLETAVANTRVPMMMIVVMEAGARMMVAFEAARKNLKTRSPEGLEGDWRMRTLLLCSAPRAVVSKIECVLRQSLSQRLHATSGHAE